MINSGRTWRQAGFAGLYWSVAIVLFLPSRLCAQTNRTVTHNPVTPLGVRPITNYPQPIRRGVGPGSGLQQILVSGYIGPNPAPTPETVPGPTPPVWSFIISGTYQFLNDRSRVGDVSFDSESGIVDLTAAYNRSPYTYFDISYLYSHASGTSPTGTSETLNQHVGSARLLQPLEPFFPQCQNWKPAAFTTDDCNHQFAIIVGGLTTEVLSGSTQTPHLPSAHSATYTFLGNALLDYQFAWFSEPCK